MRSDIKSSALPCALVGGFVGATIGIHARRE
jgi:hypothetical protein